MTVDVLLDAGPQNQHPLILCEGACGDSHLPHSYAERRVRRTIKQDDLTFDYIFTCDACGAERVYGCTGARATTTDADV